MMAIRIFQVFVVALLFVGLTHAAVADSDPWEAIQNGDYSSVEEIWLPRAVKGDIEAQLFLGHIESIRNKYSKAASWYRLAAVKGSAIAQALLANQYLSGNGVAANTLKAYALYDLAASQGHLNAVKARDLIASQLSDEQLGQAIALTESWKRDGLPQGID
jgi:TPR repeat protein